MALPNWTSPIYTPLSMSNIQSELGGVNPASLTEYYSDGLYVPANIAGFPGNVETIIPSSNTISISNFYGVVLGDYSINANVISVTTGGNILFSVNSRAGIETLFYTVEDLNPIYSWSGPTTVLEGTTANFILSATGYVPNATPVSYIISGNVTLADFTGLASLTGQLSIVNNQATLALTPTLGDGPENIEPFTISTNVNATISSNIGSGEAISYTLTADKYPSINEGDIVTWTVTTTGVPAGTVIDFTFSNVSIDDIEPVDGYLLNGLNGNLTIGSDATGKFLVEIFPDSLTELLPESITMTLTSIAPQISNTIPISDTSITTSGTAVLTTSPTFSMTPVSGSSTLPRAPVWIMFRMLGGGGGGGGADEFGDGGNGGAGTLVRGITRLPRTRSTKILYGGAGIGGVGGYTWTNAGEAGENGTPSGIGYSFTSPSALAVNGSGGDGGVGVFGKSGFGGGGGGATALEYRNSSNLAVGIPIAVAGGGAGGGGASLRRPGGHANPNGTVFANVTAGGTGLVGIYAGYPGPGADGGGGGGGGGGGAQTSPAPAGTGGTAGLDNSVSSLGGYAGLSLRNNSMTFPFWQLSETPGGVLVSQITNPDARNLNYYGIGGTGYPASKASLTRANPGSQGGIAIYWTTSLTQPTDWSLLPNFDVPTMSYPLVNQEINNYFVGPTYPGYIRFRRDGQFENSRQIFSNYTGPTAWVAGNGVNQNIGYLYDIRATIISITPGSSYFGEFAGSYEEQFGSSSPANSWINLGNSDGVVYYLTPYDVFPGAIANIRIEIRSTGSQTVLKTVFYTMTAYYDGSDTSGGGPTE